MQLITIFSHKNILFSWHKIFYDNLTSEIDISQNLEN